MTTDIHKMYHAYNTCNFLLRHGGTPSLIEAVAGSMFEDEIGRRWKLFLEAAKEAGYTRITLGPSEYCETLTQGNMVFAEPNIERKNAHFSNRIPLWDGMCDVLGGMSCGNGFAPKAVQAQLRLPPNAFRKYQGVYDLCTSTT